MPTMSTVNPGRRDSGPWKISQCECCRAYLPEDRLFIFPDEWICDTCLFAIIGQL
jgi:hypothetical protein